MPEIRLEHINKRWGKFYAVEDMNLTISDNAFVTLLGPSGCGKTTTLRMIAGLETPTSGRITIGGTDIRKIKTAHLRRNIGMVLQEPFLFSRTIGENIGITEKNMTLSDIRGAAQIACIGDDVILISPEKYR